MLIERLGLQQCDEILARLGYGRLACARDNQPYIVPIYFAHQPDNLYGFATSGQKIEWMRANPLVCVQVDEVLGPEDWISVIATGRYEELPDTPEYAQTRTWARLLLQRRGSWWQTGYAASQLRRHADAHVPILFRIRIEEMTGVRASAGERIIEKLILKS